MPSSVSTPTTGEPRAAPIAPNTIPPAQGVALTSMELKAISVPQSLLFLLSIEYDMFLCMTTVGVKKGFKLIIKTALAPSYRLLLESGAARFGLTVEHTEKDSTITSRGGSTTHLPLLRYVDYIPGSLHVDELLDCFGVNTKSLPRKAKSSAAGEDSPTAAQQKEEVFEACFIDYSPYTNDEALHDVHGCGFYLTLDYGLSLATHAHLLHVTLLPDRKLEGIAANVLSATASSSRASPNNNNNTDGSATYTASLSQFLKFSGWDKLDVRFIDETKRSAVVVLPTTQDANDLLEKYENEESDNEVDDLSDPTVATAAAFRPPFHIRPIAPTVNVPFIEDSTLRKLRVQHWGKVEVFWKRCGASKNTVTVSNLYDGISLEEVLKLFGPNVSVTSAAMVEDESPLKRRRVFVTFATSDDAKEGLALDGKNTHGKSLKIHTAPPYVDMTRRGRTIASKGLGLAALFPQTPSAAPTVPNSSPAHDATANAAAATPTATATALKSPGLNVSAKEFVPKFVTAGGGGSFSLPPPYMTTAAAANTNTSATLTPSAASAAAVPSASPPAYGGGASPFAAVALPPAYNPAPTASTGVSPIGGMMAAAASAAPFLPAYALPPPYAKQPPPPHPFTAPPPAYTPSNGRTPESPVSQN